VISGIDVSYWEPPDEMDYAAIYQAGYKFDFIRCTIGNYYQDGTFDEHWNQSFEAGQYRAPYMVVAPAAYDYGPNITVQQHMDYFLPYFGNRQAELPWALDCELTRKKSRSWITDLIGGIVTSCNSHLGRYPVIYTRQTWWDVNVEADPLWLQCPLWAARYSSVITSPWSDGYCRFRDWTTWFFWQWSDHGRIPGYAGNIDLNYFNGDLTDLALFSGNLNFQMQLRILWREAQIVGWNLQP
jgi:lysozyme